MKTRTNTTIKMKTNININVDATFKKGTCIKTVILGLVNWEGIGDLEDIKTKIDERIEFIKLNN